MQRARGHPVFLDDSLSVQLLERVILGSGEKNEDWLQQLLHERPQVLPIDRIEPGLGTLAPVAREVPCGHGFIDNLYVTGDGGIVIAEAKLWRNPQARREVVAQALDYVAALTGMSYEDFVLISAES